MYFQLNSQVIIMAPFLSVFYFAISHFSFSLVLFICVLFLFFIFYFFVLYYCFRGGVGLIVYNLPSCESRLNKKESQMLSIMVRTVCISI